MEILILTTIAAPYRVNLFNEIGKKINLTVCFEQMHDAVRNESWYDKNFTNFKGFFLRKANKSLFSIKVDFLKYLNKKNMI